MSRGYANRRRPAGAAAHIDGADLTPPREITARLVERLEQLGVQVLAYAFDRPLEAVFIDVDGRRLIGLSPRLSHRRRQEIFSDIVLTLESDSSLAFLVASEPNN